MRRPRPGGTAWEVDASRGVYLRLVPGDLSREVLQRPPERLAVLPASGLGWNDPGDPPASSSPESASL